MAITARAPVRIDFAGGWTDVTKFSNLDLGITVNSAISIYTYVIVSPIPSGIKMYSCDLDIDLTINNVKDIEYNGSMDLAKAACKRFNVDGVEIITRTDAPTGSGLGTSASLGVALVGALSAFADRRVGKERAAEIAFELETKELGLYSGKQDQYAASLGGLRTYYFDKDGVYYGYYLTGGDLYRDLEKSLILCYTGKSRLSSNIHSLVYTNFDKGINCNAISKLRWSGKLAEDALLDRNLENLAESINISWEAQKQLHHSVVDETTVKFFDVAKSTKVCMAGKATGAGGGGCLLFLAQPNKEHILRKALKEAGGQILHFNFDNEGLLVW
jgi:D-glycero-alpha-D-manno-heptose-7-phosphate kinase